MDWKVEIDKIAKWMKDYATKAKAKGYAIAVSGGLDSAIVASLCVRAVGKENVLAVNLPCYSSMSSKIDSLDLINNLGLMERYDTIDLAPTFDILVNQSKPRFFNTPPTEITLGNIKARLRMIKIYEIANHFNYLVAGTSNKSEIMVGYFTKYGDGAEDVSPIADFYKTDLYEMAKYLPEIPASIINKAPSADLWEGQTDEQQLGPYTELDAMLKNIEVMVDLPSTVDSFVFDISTHIDPSALSENSPWRKVYQLVRGAEHKNNMPPKYERKYYGE